MSWETSVKNAYERYGMIIDDWKSGKSCNRETSIQQDLFTGIGRLTDAVQRFRSIPAVSAIRESNTRYMAKHRAKKEEKKLKEEPGL